jgi:hypothetical protein
MDAPDKETIEAIIAAHNYGREKLKGLYPRNKNLLIQLATSIVPSQYMIDFGDAHNFMMMGYRRNPKAKSVNNNYFTLLALPKGEGYGYQSSPYNYTAAAISDKVAWPTIKSFDDKDIPISSADQIVEAQDMIFQELADIFRASSTPEVMRKAADVAYDNLNIIYKFLTDVDEAFKDSPAKKAKETLQAGVDEVNRLLGEAERKLNDLRMTAMMMDVPEGEVEPEPEFERPDFEAQYEEKRQKERDAEKNYDPIGKVFIPENFNPASEFENEFGNPIL